MKITKTGSNQRSTYTYTDAMGNRVTITPGMKDPMTDRVITEEDIKQLHRFDDREVENNLKNAKPPVQPWESPFIDEWKEAHPYDDLPSRYNVSLDAEGEDSKGIDDDSDKGYLGLASLTAMENENPEIERLLEVIKMLRPEQRELFQRVFIEGESLTSIAEGDGVTAQAIRNRILKIRASIQKNFWKGV